MVRKSQRDIMCFYVLDCLLIAQVFFMLFTVFVVISCELDTLNLYLYGLEVQKIKSCLMAYKLSLQAQFEIKGVKRGPYVMVKIYKSC